jgi:hypothetical protein
LQSRFRNFKREKANKEKQRKGKERKGKKEEKKRARERWRKFWFFSVDSQTNTTQNHTRVVELVQHC